MIRGLVVVLAGCGRLGFDAPDAALGVDTVAIDANGGFGWLRPLTELNTTAEEDDPTLTADELEMYFTSARGSGIGNSDIWRTTRADRDAPWSAPEVVAELSTTLSDMTPELAPDGLTIYFARGATSLHDIFMATRPSRDATWGAPVLVAELSSMGHDHAASIAPDGLSIVLTRGDIQLSALLFLATRADVASPWGSPVRIDVLDVAGATENQAWLGADAIYFTINPPGTQRIVWAPRVGATGFGAVQAIEELDGTGPESDPWLNATLSTIYFERDDDLYVAER